MNNQNPDQNQKSVLLSESTTFTRLPNPDGSGEMLEVKVNTRVRTPIGIMHDSTQSFVLGGTDATDTLASLRVIHNNLQMVLIKSQEANAAPQEDVSEEDTSNPVRATSSASAELGVASA